MTAEGVREATKKAVKTAKENGCLISFDPNLRPPLWAVSYTHLDVYKRQEYHGEKAFEYLMGTHKWNMIYRIVFSLVVYTGATQTLELVWNFSDIANALMAIPNLICMILMSGEIAKDVKEFQKIKS